MKNRLILHSVTLLAIIGPIPLLADNSSQNESRLKKIFTPENLKDFEKIHNITVETVESLPTLEEYSNRTKRCVEIRNSEKFPSSNPITRKSSTPYQRNARSNSTAENEYQLPCTKSDRKSESTITADEIESCHKNETELKQIKTHRHIVKSHFNKTTSTHNLSGTVLNSAIYRTADREQPVNTPQKPDTNVNGTYPNSTIHRVPVQYLPKNPPVDPLQKPDTNENGTYPNSTIHRVPVQHLPKPELRSEDHNDTFSTIPDTSKSAEQNTEDSKYSTNGHHNSLYAQNYQLESELENHEKNYILRKSLGFAKKRSSEPFSPEASESSRSSDQIRTDLNPATDRTADQDQPVNPLQKPDTNENGTYPHSTIHRVPVQYLPKDQSVNPLQKPDTNENSTYPNSTIHRVPVQHLPKPESRSEDLNETSTTIPDLSKSTEQNIPDPKFSINAPHKSLHAQIHLSESQLENLKKKLHSTKIVELREIEGSEQFSPHLSESSRSSDQTETGLNPAINRLPDKDIPVNLDQDQPVTSPEMPDDVQNRAYANPTLRRAPYSPWRNLDEIVTHSTPVRNKFSHNHSHSIHQKIANNLHNGLVPTIKHPILQNPSLFGRLTSSRKNPSVLSRAQSKKNEEDSSDKKKKFNSNNEEETIVSTLSSPIELAFSTPPRKQITKAHLEVNEIPQTHGSKSSETEFREFASTTESIDEEIARLQQIIIEELKKQDKSTLENIIKYSGIGSPPTQNQSNTSAISPIQFNHSTENYEWQRSREDSDDEFFASNHLDKMRLPKPPLNPNENWKYAKLLDEYYEQVKQFKKIQTSPTTYSPSSSSTSKTQTSINPTPSSTEKSKENSISMNKNINKNYNISINLIQDPYPNADIDGLDGNAEYVPEIPVFSTNNEIPPNLIPFPDNEEIPQSLSIPPYQFIPISNHHPQIYPSQDATLLPPFPILPYPFFTAHPVPQPYQPITINSPNEIPQMPSPSISTSTESATLKSASSEQNRTDENENEVLNLLKYLMAVNSKNQTSGFAQSPHPTSEARHVSDPLHDIRKKLHQIELCVKNGTCNNPQLRHSINELLTELEERREHEMKKMFYGEFNPLVGSGKQSLSTLKQIDEYIDLLEVAMVYLAKDPNKLLDEENNARLDDDESLYPQTDSQRRFIENQFYYVHPSILNEFIDVYKRYSHENRHFGRRKLPDYQRGVGRAEDEGESSPKVSIAESLDKLFHLKDLISAFLYNRNNTYRHGVD